MKTGLLYTLALGLPLAAGIAYASLSDNPAFEPLRRHLPWAAEAPQPAAPASQAAQPKESVAAAAAAICPHCGNPCAGCEAPAADEPVKVELKLAAARFNPAKGADSSLLDFKLAARWNKYNLKREVTVDRADGSTSASLELGHCSVDVRPLLSQPRHTAGRAKTAQQWSVDGGFLVTLKDDQGRVLDSAVVGDVDEPADMPEGKGFLATYVPTRGKYADAQTQVFHDTDNPTLTGMKPLIAYEVVEGAFDEQVATDPAGNRFAYRFPSAVLYVIPQALVDKERLKRLQARKVRIGWGAVQAGGSTDYDYVAAGGAVSPPYGGACGS